MARIYNELAGKSLERLSALSDGVFSVALTLLVLDLHVPVREAIHNEHDLWRAIVALSPRLVPYLMTFMTVGIFWVGQQAQLNFFERSNRDLAWIHIAFLLVITLTPFSTALLAEFITYRLGCNYLLAQYLGRWSDVVLELEVCPPGTSGQRVGAGRLAGSRGTSHCRRAGTLCDWRPPLCN